MVLKLRIFITLHIRVRLGSAKSIDQCQPTQSAQGVQGKNVLPSVNFLQVKGSLFFRFNLFLNEMDFIDKIIVS